jgi:putative ABC transport system ATP-binding protein
MTTQAVPLGPDRSLFQTSTSLLSIRDLGTNLLKPTSFSMSTGECVAIRGPSGGGKTLLLRAIADVDPNEGMVCLEGRNRATISRPEWRRLVGYVPAEPGCWAETVGNHFAEWKAAAAFLERLGLAMRRRPGG